MERRTAGVTGMRLLGVSGDGGCGGGCAAERALAAVMVGVDEEDVVERGMVGVEQRGGVVPGSDERASLALGSARLSSAPPESQKRHRTGTKWEAMTAAAQRPAGGRVGVTVP